MEKSKVIVEPSLQCRIMNSHKISPDEKDSFVRYLKYFTKLEKEELKNLV